MSERIVIDPKVCGGRPIVAGTRMRVIDVLDALAAGAGIDELVADFPNPLILSLSKDRSLLQAFVRKARRKGRSFDKLRTSGYGSD